MSLISDPGSLIGDSGSLIGDSRSRIGDFVSHTRGPTPPTSDLEKDTNLA